MKLKLLKKSLLLGLPIVAISTMLLVPSCNSNSIGDDNSDNNEDNEKPKPPVVDPNLPLGWSPITNRDNKSANQFDLSHNQKLHFNYPHYDEEKKIMSLKCDGSPILNYPSEGTPSGPNQWAKEGVITTNKHAQLAKQVFSVGFHNGVEKTGTAWILDYKLTNDGSYPLTWFFGTNAHVIDDLKVANDIHHSEKFGRWNKDKNSYRSFNTRAISLWSLNNPRIGEFKNDNFNNHEWKETRLNFYDSSKEDETGRRLEGYYLDQTPLKTIFVANDFLTISPKDDSINSYSNKEEYADFGVFEITFENEKQAKEATNNYANWKEKEKFKYHKQDLLENPSLKTDNIYTFGYPQNGSISTTAYRTISINLNQVEYAREGLSGNYSYSFSSSINYQSWTNAIGAFDAHIVTPWFGYNYEWIDNNDNGEFPERTTQYASYGLNYATNNGNMKPGSSGSLVVDDNGYALGIHYASDNNAATGEVQAFYSSGYDYKGYYGKYNLPQYDLIRGGGKYQTKSYYDGLVQWYGKDKNFKTRLFPNGLISRN